MLYEQFTHTTDPGAENGPQPLMPHALADHYITYSGGVHITMDQIDRDNSGRLGLRTDEPGNPALFHVGQVVTIERGDDSTRPRYMGEDAFLHDLGEDLPPVVQDRLNWLQEVDAQVRREQAANRHPQGEVLSVHDEEILNPLQRVARALVSVATVGIRGRKSRHSSPHAQSNNHSTRPADTRPSGTHHAQTTRPGRHRTAPTAGRHRAAH